MHAKVIIHASQLSQTHQSTSLYGICRPQGTVSFKGSLQWSNITNMIISDEQTKRLIIWTDKRAGVRAYVGRNLQVLL